MATSRYPSLSLAYDELKSRVERQAAYVESVESKAGIVIGFTALVIGLTVSQRRPVVDLVGLVGVALGAASFLSALFAYWLSADVALLRPAEFFEEFAVLNEEQTKIVLCNLAIEAFRRNAPILKRKVLALHLAFALLVGTVGTFVLAFLAKGLSE